MPQRINVYNKLVNEKFDSVSVAYPSGAVEVYTFKLGNAVVSTVTITYTDSSKGSLLSAVKT